MRLWMLSTGTVVAAAMMGVSLGAYVTRTPVSPLAESAQAAAPPDMAADTTPLPPVAEMDQGPGEIHCKGCGPTLAERRWMKDMAGTQGETPAPVVDLDIKVDPLPSAVASDDTSSSF